METFVVRVWVPADAEADGLPPGLHGVVEHVVSKRGRPFHGEADLVAFMRACLHGPPPGDAPGGTADGPGTDARDAPSVRGIPGAGPDDRRRAPGH